MYFARTALAAVAILAIGTAQAGPVITGNTSATSLANTIAGGGITVSNPTLTFGGPSTLSAPTGTFTGGASTLGFGDGIVLTNGDIACATGSNTTGGCGLDRGTINGNNVFDRTTLSFDFTSTSGQVFFQYVFGSEEYNNYVGSSFNDGFELLLNNVNIAVLPGNAGAVTINNVNCVTNSAFYRNNSPELLGNGTACPVNQPNLNLDIQYDGLTTVLTASGTVQAGTNNFRFSVFDRADGILDSGVFIRAGSFSATNPTIPTIPPNPNAVSEPGSLALVGLALTTVLAASRRRKVGSSVAEQPACSFNDPATA